MRQKSFIAAFLLLFCATSLWASDTSVDGIWYNFYSSMTASVTYRGSSYDSYSNEYTGTIVIPETVTYNGRSYRVTSIGEMAFRDCRGLTSITIPSSVTTIGRIAFRDCSGLTSVTIPSSVTSIGNAFYGCSGLTSVIIPNSITSIDNNAFNGCSSLTSVTIPNSVTIIGQEAFSNCSSLTFVSIGNSVTSIGKCAFLGCNSLNSVVWNAKNCEDFTSLYTPFFYSNPDSYIYDFDIRAHIKSFTFGDEVEYIPAYLCSKMSNLTSIYIPNSVTSVGNSAFTGCNNLTKVNISDLAAWCNIIFSGSSSNPLGYAKHLFLNDVEIIDLVIPNNITSIGSSTFRYCTGLSSLTLGSNVTSIGVSAFDGCNIIKIHYNGTIEEWCNKSWNPSFISSNYSLFIKGEKVSSCELPNSVTSIGENAFNGCNSLISIVIPNSVTSIGNLAFQDCSTLTSVAWNAKNCNDFSSAPFTSAINSFAFGEEVERIPSYLCSGLNNLTSITIPNSIISIGEYAINGCSSLTSIDIPSSVKSIGDRAFQGCSNITSVVWKAKNCNGYNFGNQVESFSFGDEVEYIPNNICNGMKLLNSIEIPNSVTSIGDQAFQNCTGLTAVTIPNNVTSIGNAAFSGCSGLTSISIGNSVTSIKDYAFSGCSGLTSITIPKSVRSIGNDALRGCNNITSVVWNAKHCGSNFSSTNTPFYHLPSGTYIEGFDIRTRIKSFTFGDEVEYIPGYLCSGLNNLASITIPNSVTYIGERAFYGCSSLTDITIPTSVKEIHDRAFISCYSLTSVVWNAKYCYTYFSSSQRTTPFTSSVTSFTFGDEVEHIPGHLCSGLDKLTSVSIPNSVKSIDEYAFQYCNSVTSIVWNAKNCNDFSSAPFKSSVTSFTLGDEVEHIPAYLCYDMTTLPSINIPHSVTSVGEKAFYGCKYPIYVECGDLERMQQLLSDYAYYVQYEPAPIYNLSTKATNGTIYTTKTKFTVCEEPLVTCTANATRGYQFVKWADGNTENPRTIELTQDTIMEALFEIATSGKCGRDNALVWKYDTITKALTITGEGELDANYTYGTFIESVTIGNSVTIIGSEAFYNCSNLTSITIPNSVTSIGSYAFYGCSSLVTATIGNGVTTINKQAFYNCSNLETVSLGGSIETIESKAFYNCTRIIDIYCYAERVPEAYSDAFDGVSRKAYLWVPANRVRNYKTHELWGEFDVQAIEADGVNTSTVNIVPTDNTAKIIWPAVENADTYEITIYDQNGNIVCQLVFDSEGLLQSIAFGAPGRDNAPEATQATGFRFEVSSLTPGTTYNYTIVAKDATESVIDTKEGSFTTTGTTAVEDIVTNSVGLQKVLRNGQLFILRDGSRYTVTGVKVE